MKDDCVLKIVGISAILIGYGIGAIQHGLDGILFTAVMSTIALIVGVELGQKKAAKKVKEEDEETEAEG